MKYKATYYISVIIFLLILAPIQKTNAQMIEPENDSWKYFHDITLEIGSYITMSSVEDFFSDATVFSLSGSYYWDNKFGIRSGISCIMGVDGSDKYFKLPVLFSFRTRTFTSNWEPDYEYENFGSMLLHFLFNILPTRFELNIGVSLGYMTPESYVVHRIIDEKKVLSQTADIRSPFASSIDTNVRLSFQFGRVGIPVNFGMNYLLTGNYDYRLYYPREEKIRSLWFANLSVGLSYRF